MGVCSSGNFPYYSIDDEEERLIRQFEREKLKISEFSFSELISNLNSAIISNSGSLTFSQLSNFVTPLNSPLLEELLKQPFFQNGAYINHHKVALLLFLLAQPTLKPKKHYETTRNYDKSSFFCNTVADGDEFLTKTSGSLLKMINLLVELSCNVLVEFYVMKEETATVNVDLPLKEKVTEMLFDILFSNNQEAIQESDMNYFFNNDFYFLFPGYIREVARKINGE